MHTAFDGSAEPVSLYELQAKTEESFVRIQHGWNKEHTHEGRHGTLAVLDVEGEAEIRGAVTLNSSVYTDNTSDARYEATLTATTNDLAQADGLAIPQSLILLSAASAQTLTGIVPSDPDKFEFKRLINIGNGTITLAHNNTGSAAGNRFKLLPVADDYGLVPGETADLLYAANSGAWLIYKASSGGDVQRGTITINTGATSGTATLSPSVDRTRARLRFLGWSASNGGNTAETSPRLEFTNDTTLTAYRGTTSASVVVTVGWEVEPY